MPAKLDTASVLERMLDVYRAQAGLFLPAAVVIFVPVAILAALATGGGGRRAGLSLVTALLAFVASYAYQGIVVEAVRDIQDGRRDFTLEGLLRSVAPVVLPLAGASVLAAIGLTIGFALLVVPGLIFLTFWALLVPVLVIERTGIFAAFRRSAELVRGNAWRVFGIVVVLFLLSNVLSSVVSGLAGTAVGNALVGIVVNALVVPLTAIASSLMYLDLRRLHGEPPVPAGAPS